MEDIGSRPEYSGVIGKKFRATQELMTFGITLDANYKKVVDYVLIAPSPGISGPEVVTKGILAKGSTVEIVGVRRSSFLFFTRVHYVVTTAAKSDSKAPLHIKQTGSLDDGNFGLDRALFEPVK